MMIGVVLYHFCFVPDPVVQNKLERLFLSTFLGDKQSSLFSRSVGDNDTRQRSTLTQWAYNKLERLFLLCLSKAV
jgi:hypothetical protein